MVSGPPLLSMCLMSFIVALLRYKKFKYFTASTKIVLGFVISSNKLARPLSGTVEELLPFFIFQKVSCTSLHIRLYCIFLSGTQLELVTNLTPLPFLRPAIEGPGHQVPLRARHPNTAPRRHQYHQGMF